MSSAEIELRVHRANLAMMQQQMLQLLRPVCNLAANMQAVQVIIDEIEQANPQAGLDADENHCPF